MKIIGNGILYKTKLFTLVIPGSWESKTFNSVYSFFDSEGYGSVQISAYKSKPSKMGIDLFNELKKRALQKGAEKFNTLSIKKGNHVSYLTNFTSKERYWIMMISNNKKIIALITYNCESIYKKKEQSIVKKILKSFKLK